MDISCPRCRTAIPIEEMNLADRRAKCPACRAIFDVSSLASDGPVRRRPPVPMPEGIRVVEESDADPGTGDYREAAPRRGRLTITRRWRTSDLVFLVFFCIFWNGFLFFWYRNALHMDSVMRWLFMVFPVIHVAVGVGLTYRTIAGFLNTTTITVTPEALTIRHAPLPWPWNRSISADDLVQLYSEQVVSKGGKGGTSVTYSLSAVLRDGRKQALLTGLPSANQPLFIEQRVEECLGIVDTPVAGELPG